MRASVAISLCVISMFLLAGCKVGTQPAGQLCITMEEAKQAGIIKAETPIGGEGKVCLTIEQAKELGLLKTEQPATPEVIEEKPVITEEKKPAVTEEKKPEAAASLPTKKVKEGELVSFPNLKATDPDGDPITYTFTAPLNAKGEWKTKAGDAGEHKVTITASDGKSETKQDVLIVVEALNNAPLMEKLSDVTVNEGEKVMIKPIVTDADGDKVTVSYSGWMTSAEYTTTFQDAGDHQVTVTATDGKATVSQAVKVTVKDVNRAPVLSEFKPVSVTEGDKVVINPIAIDQDKDVVAITYEKLFDSKGAWQTKKGDAGTYDVKITASDGKASDVKTIKVTVLAANSPPAMEKLADMTVSENSTITISPKVSDADGDQVTVSYSGWMNSASYKTNFQDAGDHQVTVTATDGKATVSQTIKITVEDVNRPPDFVGI